MNPSVLIVDTSLDQIKDFLLRLQQPKNRVEFRIAVGFDDALERIYNDGIPDIIISTVVLDTEDAISLFHRIKENGFEPKFILMGRNKRLLREIGVKNDMDGILLLPLNNTSLLEQVLWLNEK